jgi:mono/diheme cytochrome c family protein
VILENKCLSCHKPGEHAGHIPLSTRSDLLNSPLDLVIPGKPDESGLMIVVSPGARKQMPPMDSGIAPLTKNQRDLIRTWILNGAL